VDAGANEGNDDVTTLIDGRDLTFALDGVRLIDGVSITAEAQELVAVVGPNGAGKSTLLRLLAGDLSPTAGSVSILGESVAGASLGELALRRSYLTEHPTRDVPFTVREVVAMGRHPHRARPENTAADDDAAIDAALQASDLAQVEDRVFATLSGGEEQRANVARILAQQAPVALLDEPTAALDVGHQQLVMRGLRSTAEQGGTTVIVLHDLNLAATFADRVLLLDAGVLVAAGTPHEVLREKPLSAVYRHPIRVIDHPFRDGPLVLPVDD
jgi:iron complex transport system ATP-binding protein